MHESGVELGVVERVALRRIYMHALLATLPVAGPAEARSLGYPAITPDSQVHELGTVLEFRAARTRMGRLCCRWRLHWLRHNVGTPFSRAKVPWGGGQGRAKPLAVCTCSWLRLASCLLLAVPGFLVSL